MKKIILIAFLGMFVFAAATSFAGSLNTPATTPIAQFDDDPKAEKKECDGEKKKECAKKCDKAEEKKCCKKAEDAGSDE